MRRSARLSALIALAAMAAGCNDGPAAPLPIPVEPVTTAAQQAGPARTHSVFISSTGLSMERAEMQPVLTELTRQVALALGDPVTRMAVFDALHASPYREHKLRLRTLLTQAGSPLAAAIAQRSMRRPAAVLATLDSVIYPEIYLPVPSHFIQWHGGPEVLVASVLDRSDVPIAFDGEGTAIPSMSAVVPPNRPTIVLVQV